MRGDRPKDLFRGSIAPSMIASILNVKCVNSALLHRIRQEFSRNGDNISKQIMSKWMIGSANRYFTPLVECMKQELLKLPVTQSDELCETRARFNAMEFLNGFHGYLETDCYQGNLPGIRRCCCFAHLRRYFIEAVLKGKELDYSNPVAQGVQYINRLFEHERYSAAQKHTHEQRYTYRLEKEKSVLDAFWKWISQ